MQKDTKYHRPGVLGWGSLQSLCRWDLTQSYTCSLPTLEMGSPHLSTQQPWQNTLIHTFKKKLQLWNSSLGLLFLVVWGYNPLSYCIRNITKRCLDHLSCKYAFSFSSSNSYFFNLSIFISTHMFQLTIIKLWSRKALNFLLTLPLPPSMFLFVSKQSQHSTSTGPVLEGIFLAVQSG